ncbi:hypothetical protein FHR98_000017 [Limibacillus halophilus]|uniref:Uncharacterized protein n=1 Tax=Limibacillus halophilus TaxID=1579333 RepID=A0A839SMT6_9PROT|nr:hypothetical protein [Limibacillus halophilus]
MLKRLWTDARMAYRNDHLEEMRQRGTFLSEPAISLILKYNSLFIEKYSLFFLVGNFTIN